MERSISKINASSVHRDVTLESGDREETTNNEEQLCQRWDREFQMKLIYASQRQTSDLCTELKGTDFIQLCDNIVLMFTCRNLTNWKLQQQESVVVMIYTQHSEG